MPLTEEVQDLPLWQAFDHALQQGVEEAARVVAENRYISDKREWPKLTGYFDSGMPHFSYSIGLGDGPTDYTSILTGHRSDAESFPWYREFRDFCRAHDRVRAFYSPEGEISDSSSEKFFGIHIALLLGDFIDAYIYRNGGRNDGLEYAPEKAISMYLEWERSMYLQELPLALLTPLLFLKCEFDELELSPLASIVKLEKPQQLARMVPQSFFRYMISDAQRTVVGAATHALVCKGWQVEQQKTSRELRQLLSSRSAFSLDPIENFFCSLRLAGNYQTGYGQVMVAPIGWSPRVEGNLPSWMQFSTKRYPARFEDYYWLSKELSTLTLEQAILVKELFQALEKSRKKEFVLARSRINFAALRENEEDAAIDASIALEALLTADSKQEMTYKLAVRLAALSRLTKFSKSPAQVFREIKKLYEYRSAIVHGSASAEKKREIKLTNDKPIPAVVAAEEYAKLAMKILLQHPRYLDSQLIDTELLLADAVDSKETLDSVAQECD